MEEDHDRLLRDDELAGSRAAYINADTIHHTHSHTRPFLLSQNRALGKMNIRIILSALLIATLLGSLLAYYYKRDARVLFIPMIADLIAQTIAIILYCAYPIDFQLSPIRQREMISKELGFMTAKILMIIVCYMSLTKREQYLAWAGLIIAFMILLTTASIDYSEAYDSLFKLSNCLILLTVVLLLFRIHTNPQQSLTWTFIGQLVLGWLLMAGFVIACLAWICIICLLIRTGNFRIISVLLNISQIGSILVQSLVCLGVIKLLDDKRMAWITHYDWVLMAGIVYTLYVMFTQLFLGSAYGPDLQDPMQRPDNNVEQRSGMNYVLNIMQASPTFFVSPTAGAPPRTDQQPPENSECLICYEHPSNCVIFDCMHSGVCKQCATSVLKKSSKCMICRKPISKIAVVEKQNDQQYLVTDEIYIS